MTDRPILFSGPMVRALLDGTKTQTRRVVKPQPVSVGYQPLVSFNHGCPEVSFGREDKDARGLRWWRCPYGQVGDRLWVREAHTIHNTHGQHRSDDQRWGPWGDLPTRFNEDRTKIAYFREGFDRSFCGTWKPSIHMPRWASRLTLQITEIRVERLQDISNADAIAEGLSWVTPGMWSVDRSLPIIGDDARQVYFELWDHINGKGSYAANPWVWAVSFEVVK